MLTFPSATMTVREILQSRDMDKPGTAVAVNGKLCKASEWDLRQVEDNDTLMVISAAFGG